MNAVDLRPDADAGRRHGRGVLDLAADAEQVGVVAGQTDDVARAVTRDGDQEVPVGDAPDSAVRTSVTPGQLGDSAHRPDQVFAQLSAQVPGPGPGGPPPSRDRLGTGRVLADGRFAGRPCRTRRPPHGHGSRRRSRSPPRTSRTTDEGLEDRPRRQPVDGVAERLDERVDGRVREGSTGPAEVAEDRRSARCRC